MGITSSTEVLSDSSGNGPVNRCGGNSQSFIEGCEAYAAEVQQQMIEDGECEDWDEDERCG